MSKYRRHNWQKLFAEFEQSGLSQVEFCKQHDSPKDVRDYCGWGNTQLKIHLGRLEDMEYLIVHGGGRGKTISYERVYNGEGKAGESFLSGLIDVKKLGYDAKKSGVNKNKSGLSRPQVAPKSVGGRDGENENNTVNTVLNGIHPELLRKNTSRKNNGALHPTENVGSSCASLRPQHTVHPEHKVTL